ncbi:MAG: response regulator transcription factor [Gammaproteobacteria bacterium]|nr:response regulator transcription factor [Gammaproteobacteria bacterium]
MERIDTIGVSSSIPAHAAIGRRCGVATQKLGRIAVLEDDPAQAELLLNWLDNAGFSCTHHANGRSFLQDVLHGSYDLAILDWGLPDMSGDEVLMEMRSAGGWRMPVVFITSRDEEADVVHALRQGADDYMCKPVRQEETLARVNALLRRARPEQQDQVFSFPPFEFDVRSETVTRDGEAVTLTRKEYEFALFLFRNAGRLLSRSYILETVWGTRGDLNTRTIDTHVSRIRTKLGLNPACGWRLSSVYQHGYRLESLSDD